METEMKYLITPQTWGLIGRLVFKLIRLGFFRLFNVTERLLNLTPIPILPGQTLVGILLPSVFIMGLQLFYGITMVILVPLFNPFVILTPLIHFIFFFQHKTIMRPLLRMGAKHGRGIMFPELLLDLLMVVVMILPMI